ncbi:M48 family metallopeptidase [Fervidobacterium sp.]
MESKGSRELEYTIVRKKTKKITLKVDLDGGLRLIVPKRMSEEQVREFLMKNMSAIEQMIHAVNERKKSFVSKNSILYLGKEMSVKLETSAIVPISFDGECFILNPRYAEYINILGHRWLRRKAEEYLPKRLSELSKEIGVKYARVQVRDVKSRWGSCSSKGTISLNWRLIMAPQYVIDYVLIHELAHIPYPNHGKGFWIFVEEYCPRYKECRDWLKKNGIRLFYWSVEIENFVCQEELLDS